jgi:acid stress-induced BolA-like protein IbaG/YrbA
MISTREIEKILQEKIPAAEVKAEDLTGTQDHFQVIVVSEAFEGKGPVEQHQLVYGALRDQMVSAIHALTLKTYTPQEWEKVKGQFQPPRGIS